MDYDKLELVRDIGDEICEDCNEYRDCGLAYDECPRIDSAINLLDKYVEDLKPKT